MGFASLTVRARPSSCDPFNCVIALSASSSDIVTKPKPFERPVSRSVMMLTASTVPQCAKASLTSFSVVWKERFPTNNFFDNFIHLTCKETSGTFAVGINKQSITGQDQEAAEQLKFSDLIIADPILHENDPLWGKNSYSRGNSVLPRPTCCRPWRLHNRRRWRGAIRKDEKWRQVRNSNYAWWVRRSRVAV